MSKLYVLSIQGQQIYYNNCSQISGTNYSDISRIKIFNMQTGNKLDWKLGVFTQSQGQIHTDEEIKALEELGLHCYYMHPWKYGNENNKDATEVLKKLDLINFEDENEEEEYTFDGLVIIGEIEEEKAKELSNKYKETHYVY